MRRRPRRFAAPTSELMKSALQSVTDPSANTARNAMRLSAMSLRSGKAKMRAAARVSPTPITKPAATAIAKAIPASIPS